MTKCILITGAGSGIGLTTALHLAENGFQVYASIASPDQKKAVLSAAAERGLDLKIILLDVTDETSIQIAVKQIIEECGSIYGLVNNAGLGLRSFFEDLSQDEIRRLFEVNVFGAMAITKAVLPSMRSARRGHIIMISSAGGRIATMSLSAYCASKFALEGFAEALALESFPLGLSVSIIEPGIVNTPHFTINRGRGKAATNPDSPYYNWFLQHENMVDNILKQNRVTPLDVATMVAKALSAKQPKLRYVVGWRAKLLISLRKHLPGEIFERFYFRKVAQLVTRPSKQAKEFSGL